MWNLQVGIVDISATTTEDIPKFERAPLIIPQVKARNYNSKIPLIMTYVL